MEVNNTAFVSPAANAQYGVAHTSGFVERILGQLNLWSVALTLLLVAITYDQCTFFGCFEWPALTDGQAHTDYRNMESLARHGRRPSLGPSLTQCNLTSRSIRQNGLVVSSAASQSSTSEFSLLPPWKGF